LPDQFMDARRLPYPNFTPKPFEKLKSLCQPPAPATDPTGKVTKPD